MNPSNKTIPQKPKKLHQEAPTNPQNHSSTVQYQSPNISKLKINNLLYHRYASTQNYHYVKLINNILLDERTPPTIAYKDIEDLISCKSQGTLIEFIPKENYKEFILHLIEFYKFHNEIPRIFCDRIYEIYFDYHDFKRQRNYEKVTNNLKLEKGENPYEEKEKEVIRKRLRKYKPILTSFFKKKYLREEYKFTGNEEKKTVRHTISHTLEDIYNNLRILEKKKEVKIKKDFHKKDVSFKLPSKYDIKDIKNQEESGNYVDIDFLELSNFLEKKQKRFTPLKDRFSIKKIKPNFDKKIFELFKKKSIEFEKKSDKSENLKSNFMKKCTPFKTSPSKFLLKRNSFFAKNKTMKLRNPSNEKKKSKSRIKKKSFKKSQKKNSRVSSEPLLKLTTPKRKKMKLKKKRKKSTSSHRKSLSSSHKNSVIKTISNISTSKLKQNIFKKNSPKSKKLEIFKHKRVKSEFDILNMNFVKKNENFGYFKKLNKRTKSIDLQNEKIKIENNEFVGKKMKKEKIQSTRLPKYTNFLTLTSKENMRNSIKSYRDFRTKFKIFDIKNPTFKKMKISNYFKGEKAISKKKLLHKNHQSREELKSN